MKDAVIGRKVASTRNLMVYSKDADKYRPGAITTCTTATKQHFHHIESSHGFGDVDPRPARCHGRSRMKERMRLHRSGFWIAPVIANGMSRFFIWYCLLLGQSYHGFQLHHHRHRSILFLHEHRFPFHHPRQQLDLNDVQHGPDGAFSVLTKSQPKEQTHLKNETASAHPILNIQTMSSRRHVVSALAIGTMMIGVVPLESSSALPWQATPVNKRTGVTVFDAESAGYTVSFVTYLSRFLLTFDESCQRWWYDQVRV